MTMTIPCLRSPRHRRITVTDDPMKRFDKLLKAMVSGPPPEPKGEPQQSAGLPEGDRRRRKAASGS